MNNDTQFCVNPVCDTRLANSRIWHLIPPPDFNMRIPDSIKQCVVFIGVEINSVQNFCGTGFFVRIPAKIENHSFVYLVTARHVVADIGKRDFFIRVNLKNGGAIAFKGDSTVKWWFHPKEDEASDVAVFQMVFPPEIVRDIDFGAIPIESLLTDNLMKSDPIAASIGDGDEVFITGLFSHHSGTERNLPIIRMGNIAMMPHEPIRTDTFGNMEAYLIECRSIGGLSGSPVFVLKEHEPLKWTMYLLGLVHGHWDVKEESKTDFISIDSKIKAGMNVGIAVVAPAKKILETIHQKELADFRSEQVTRFAKNPPTPDKQ